MRKLYSGFLLFFLFSFTYSQLIVPAESTSNRYFFEEERNEKVTLAEILTLAGERIFGFLLVILSLPSAPSAFPVPAPGYSTPFGIAIFFLAVQLIMGRDYLWLPAKILKGSTKLETV